MTRALTAFVLLLAVLASACSDAPTTLPSAESAVPNLDVEEASARVVHGNPTGIYALASALEAAWGAKDASAYAALYAEDVEFIRPTARIISGRDALRAAHVFVFSTVFAQSTLDAQVRRIQFLTRKIAIVDLDFTMTGFTALPPGLRATEPDVVRHKVRWVVERRRPDGWQILGQQMTPVPPQP